jgi:hypothetical protein
MTNLTRLTPGEGESLPREIPILEIHRNRLRVHAPGNDMGFMDRGYLRPNVVFHREGDGPWWWTERMMERTITRSLKRYFGNVEIRDCRGVTKRGRSRQ